MALNKEVWIADIQENIKMNAEFLSAVTNHDAYIVNRTVHVPQAGSVMGVQVDRASYPATVKQRTDSELTYNVRQFTVDPVLITNLEEFQISYDKRKSIMGEAFSFLGELMGNEALFAYAGGNITKVETTGAASAVAPIGATGTRKMLRHQDIAKAAAVLDKQMMPKSGRKLLIPTDMFYQLLESDEVFKAAYNGFSKNVLETGIVAQLYGFDIMVRNHVALFTTAGVLKNISEAPAAGDKLGALAWHPSAVAKAMGATDVLYNENDPQYYGSILSAIQWAGFSKLRSDNKGVVALIQGA